MAPTAASRALATPSARNLGPALKCGVPFAQFNGRARPRAGYQGLPQRCRCRRSSRGPVDPIPVSAASGGALTRARTGRPGDLRLRPPLDAEHGRCQPPPRPAARHRSADREPARPDRRSGPVAADPMSVWTPMAGNPDRAGTRRRGLVRHASGERRGKRERQKHNPQICHLRSSVGTVVRGCTTRAQRPLPHDRSPGTKGASAMSAVRDGKTVPGV